MWSEKKRIGWCLELATAIAFACVRSRKKNELVVSRMNEIEYILQAANKWLQREVKKWTNGFGHIQWFL